MDRRRKGSALPVQHENGRRWTGVDVYLRPATGEVTGWGDNVNVRHVQLSGRKATGVVLNDGQALTANRRVILCAGLLERPVSYCALASGHRGMRFISGGAKPSRSSSSADFL